MSDIMVLFDKDAWLAAWGFLKKKAKEADEALAQFGKVCVARLNEIPGMSAFTQAVFNLPEIPLATGKWVGRGGALLLAYGGYRSAQWVLDNRLDNKMAATESDLLPFLDLLKLQDLRRGDYRDVLHFCIDHRFFVTQFPASPPHKFKKAVPALYELIQAYGTANERKSMNIEDFLAATEVQSLFFESEDDYKLIEYEIYSMLSKQKLDVAIKTVQDLWLLVQNPDKIVHIFDLPVDLNPNRTQLGPFLNRYAIVIGRIVAGQRTNAGETAIVINEDKDRFKNVKIMILRSEFTFNVNAQIDLTEKEDFDYVFEDNWISLYSDHISFGKVHRIEMATEAEFLDQDIWITLDNISHINFKQILERIYQDCESTGSEYNFRFIGKISKYPRNPNKYWVGPDTISVFKLKKVN